MLVACGVAERDGKVLICKRSGSVPFSGLWEFPSAELSGGETVEDCAESAFFDRLLVNIGSARPIFAFDSRCLPGCRIFAVSVQLFCEKLELNGYDDAKWVSLNKLHKFRFLPDCVTIIKSLQKKSLFFRN